MKPLYRLNIIPSLPEQLTPLWELGHNLWWSWSKETIRTLYQIDPEVWIESQRDPLRFWASLRPDQLDALIADEQLRGRIERVVEQFAGYLSQPTWFGQTHGESPLQVAYFSAEFGLTESLRIYSGGLGVLAGDHLKAASDLGIPLVGVGLLYREGYFRQALNADGWQIERNPENDFYQMPIQPVHGRDGGHLTIEVPFAHGSVQARLWQVQVGRVPLYLLDTNLDENAPCGPRYYRSSLRRRRGHAHPPRDSPRHRRPTRPASRGHRTHGLPHERGALGLFGPRADSPVNDRARLFVCHGPRGQHRRQCVHHAHPGCGGQRLVSRALD